MSDTPGHDDRRALGRRQADKEEHVQLEESRTFLSWLERQLKKTATLGALYMLAASLVGWVGGRIISPKEESDALRTEVAERFSRNDSLRTALAAELKAVDSVHSSAIRELQIQAQQSAYNDKFQSYALCIIARRVDPSITPPECGAVIQTYRRP